MKKKIIITFDIYQDTLDNQNPDFTIYSENIPNNQNNFTVKELKKSGLKKMIKFNPETREISDKLARKYIIIIPEKKLKELLDF
jgi:hypothetical protein